MSSDLFTILFCSGGGGKSESGLDPAIGWDDNEEWDDDEEWNDES
jgi:hypothetical protein